MGIQLVDAALPGFRSGPFPSKSGVDDRAHAPVGVGLIQANTWEL